MTIKICINNGCIGCGFCSLICPVAAISMEWVKKKTWQPIIDDKTCTWCGLCMTVCPNSMGNLIDAGEKAWQHGEYFGINSTDYTYAITHESKSDNRIRSASGGTTTVLLKCLLESKLVDCVICAESKMAIIGQPHFALKICYSSDEIDACRSSAYGPIRYDQVLKELIEKNLSCAMTALPCTLRAIKKLPGKFNKHIIYTIGIMCSHNVTDQFTDFLAHKHGIQNEAFKVNLRDKFRIPDANQFNTCFQLNNGKTIRTPRLKNGFTHYWRNYSFAQEACFYCPDFFAANADISVKDAWGRLSEDPLGLTLVIIRNIKLKAVLNELSKTGEINVSWCNQNEISGSQKDTVIYKQKKVWSRWFTHPELKDELIKLNHGEPFTPVQTELHDFKAKLKQCTMTQNAYCGSFISGYKRVIFRSWINLMLSKLKQTIDFILQIFVHLKDRCLNIGVTVLRVLGFREPYRFRGFEKGPLRIIITSGSGYGNVGDEAQLGANICRWKELVKGCEITVFSPYPSYTSAQHEVYSVNGPRVVWFNANHCSDYGKSNNRFMIRFIIITMKMIVSSMLMRANLPIFFIRADEAALLNQIHRSDVLHISGGGFLTGMTRSRLWENMLLMRVAHILGTQTILSGQTIGVFENNTDRKLAKWGLEHARFIYLRDNGDSEADVNSLGINGNHIKSTFDDALFCKKVSKETALNFICQQGLDVSKPYIVTQFHFWGQTEMTQQATALRFAQLCDFLIEKHGVQILFVPMVQTDENAEKVVIQLMNNPASLLCYDYDYRMARGIMAESLLTFTLKHHPIIFSMGECVPSVAVCLDDYYYRKNHGALSNCGHQDLCLDNAAFMGQKAFDTLDKAIEKNLRLRNEISFWINGSKNIENEIFNRYIQESIELFNEINEH